MRDITVTGAGRIRFSRLVLAVALAALVTGCSSGRGFGPTKTASVDPMPVGSVSAMTEPQLRATADRLGQSYVRDPKNKTVAMQYANVLQMSGRNDQAVDRTGPRRGIADGNFEIGGGRRRGRDRPAAARCCIRCVRRNGLPP